MPFVLVLFKIWILPHSNKRLYSSNTIEAGKCNYFNGEARNSLRSPPPLSFCSRNQTMLLQPLDITDIFLYCSSRKILTASVFILLIVPCQRYFLAQGMEELLSVNCFERKSTLSSWSDQDRSYDRRKWLLQRHMTRGGPWYLAVLEVRNQDSGGEGVLFKSQMRRQLENSPNYHRAERIIVNY